MEYKNISIYYQDINVGRLYECMDILGIPVRDWHRNQPTPNVLRVEYPLLNNHELFVALEMNAVKEQKDLYDVKVLTAKGDIGWLFLWKKYPFPAKVL